MATSGLRTPISELQSDFHGYENPESVIRNLESPDAIDPAPRAGRGVPGGLRLAGRAARRADRFTRHPAGGRLFRPRRPAARDGSGDLLATAERILARRVRPGPARGLLGRAGAQRALDRRDPARPVPGALVGVLSVADRGR